MFWAQIRYGYFNMLPKLLMSLIQKQLSCEFSKIFQKNILKKHLKIAAPVLNDIVDTYEFHTDKN